MNLHEYQLNAIKTAIYPTKLNARQESVYANLGYPVLGLVGEAGEVADKVKKLIRDKEGAVHEEDVRAIVLELGDVLWYLAICANVLGYTLDSVAQLNLEKLAARKDKGTLKGNGDSR